MKKNTIVLSLFLTSSLSYGFDFGSIASEAMKSFTSEKSSTTNVATTTSISQETVSSGLKEALKTGVSYAVKELGTKNGYLNNAKVKIGLPDTLNKAETAIRAAGGDKYADELILSMNNAATNAAPKTADIFIKSIEKMNIDDAKKILSGDKNAATDYFKSSSYEDLRKVISPIVKESIKSSSVASYYDSFNTYYKQGAAMVTKNDSIMGFAKQYGVDKFIPMGDDKSLNEHITTSAIDGLFLMIAQKESEIRKNPVEQTTSLLKQVFGN